MCRNTDLSASSTFCSALRQILNGMQHDPSRDRKAAEYQRVLDETANDPDVREEDRRLTAADLDVTPSPPAELSAEELAAKKQQIAELMYDLDHRLQALLQQLSTLLEKMVQEEK